VRQPSEAAAAVCDLARGLGYPLPRAVGDVFNVNHVYMRTNRLRVRSAAAQPTKCFLAGLLLLPWAWGASTAANCCIGASGVAMLGPVQHPRNFQSVECTRCIVTLDSVTM
jgi:hypothetical protein